MGSAVGLIKGLPVGPVDGSNSGIVVGPPIASVGLTETVPIDPVEGLLVRTVDPLGTAVGFVKKVVIVGVAVVVSLGEAAGLGVSTVPTAGLEIKNAVGISVEAAIGNVIGIVDVMDPGASDESGLSVPPLE